MLQTSFGFNRHFWAIRRPLFQGHVAERYGVWIIMVVSGEADPFHLSAGSSSTGSNRLPRDGAIAPRAVLN